MHLSRYLQAAGDEPETVVLVPGGDGEPPAQACVAVDPPAWAWSGRAAKLWWEQRGVLRAARVAGVSLLHTPYFSAPRLAALPVVATIHDVIPLLYPEYAGTTAMRLYLRLVTASARRARRVITDSECSRRDIQRCLRIPAERIDVVPLAVDERFRPLSDGDAERALRGRFGLAGPVIFNVGGLDVRKNLPALIEAFAQALPELDPATRLVIAGGAHSSNQRLYPPLEPLIRRVGLDGKVVLTGPISDEEKITFYNLADVYVFPSLYEGFGFSPLEAMACGTATVSSNRSSLPEVVGSGGLLVDPTPPRLAAAIVSVLSDAYFRRELEHRALLQAQRFSWERTAEMTREVYRAALAANGRQAAGSGAAS